MTQTQPTLTAPMRPSTVDFGAILAGHAEQAARTLALRPGNKDRLFDGLMAAGITHVTVIFDGAGDSGQIESIGAWSGDKAVDLPATEISYAAITWDDPEVEITEEIVNRFNGIACIIADKVARDSPLGSSGDLHNLPSKKVKASALEVKSQVSR